MLLAVHIQPYRVNFVLSEVSQNITEEEELHGAIVSAGARADSFVAGPP